MIRLAVLARSDATHRNVHRFVQDVSDVSLALRLRSERELTGLGGIDVLLADIDAIDDVEGLVERVEPLPIVLIGSAAGSLAELSERLDGFGLLVEWDLPRVIAAARAASLGLVVREHDTALGEGETHQDDLDLTARELDVLELLARGQSNSQIATSLGVSTNTVKFHLAGLYSKLGVRSRSEAAWEAFQRGILSL